MTKENTCTKALLKSFKERTRNRLALSISAVTLIMKKEKEFGLSLFKLLIKCESKIKILAHKQGLNFPPSNTVRTKRTQDVSELHTPTLRASKIRTSST